MRIKNQERIMSAVKRVLDAENAQAAYTPRVYPNRKISAETAKRRRAAELEVRSALTNAIDAARADLRKAHTEIVHEEYA